MAEGGFRLDRAALWDRLGERGPAGRLRLTVFRRDELVEVEVPLAEAPEDAVWLEPVAAPTADAARGLRGVVRRALPGSSGLS